MGGLAAANRLSSSFETITVLEREALPSAAIARSGHAQARQTHVLLRGGLDALSELLPDLEMELERAGAVRVRSALKLGSNCLALIRFRGAISGRLSQHDAAAPGIRGKARCPAREHIALNPHCRVTGFLEAPGKTRGGACATNAGTAEPRACG